MKKLMSLLVTTSMLSAMAAVPVSAGNVEAYKGDYLAVPQDWTVDYHQSNTSWNKKQDYTGITLNEGVDNGSAMVVNIQSPAEAQRYIMLTNTLSETLVVGEKYCISFDAKGIGDSGFSTNLDWSNTIYKGGYTTTANGDFTTYSVEVEAAKDTDKLNIVFENKINCVIDNVSVKKSAEEATELVKNGTFEKYKYNFDTPSDAPYKVSKSWSLSHVGERTNPSGDYATITDKARTGKYAFLINWSSGWKGNTYVRLSTIYNVHLEKDNKYTLEFYAKQTPGSEGIWSGVIWGDNSITSQLNSFTKSEPDKDGWVKFSKEYTYAGETKDTKNFGFLMDVPGTMVIDDISFVNSAAPTKNLIQDGGFEGSVFTHEKTGRYKFNNVSVETGGGIYNSESKIYIEPSKAEAHGGKYSLHLVTDDAKNNNYYVKAIYNKALPIGKYSVSFWAKGNGSYGTPPRVGLNGSWTAIDGYTIAETKEDGWSKYETEWNLTSEASGLNIWVDGSGTKKITDWYFDDFSIVDSDGTDYAAELNGFENVSENASYNTEIKHLMAYPTTTGKGLNVSWTNPKNGIIKDIDVYIDGVAVNNNAYDLKNGAFNEMYVDGLTNNQTYNVEVKVKLSDDVVTASTTGTPDGKGSMFSWNGWTVNRMERTKTVGGQNYPIHSNYNFTTDAGVTGNALKLDINRPEAVANLYPNFRQSVTAVKGQKHVLKLKYKAEDVSSFFVIADYKSKNAEDKDVNSWTWLGTGIGTDNQSTNGEWVEKTWILANGEDGTVKVGENNNSYFYTEDEFDDTASTELPVDILIATEQGVGTIWIDDVEFYALDEFEEPMANQVVNGTFDETYQVYEPEFTNANGEKITNLEAGKVNVSAKIKNNAYSDGIDAFVAMGLYKDGVLTALTVGERNVNVSASATPADEFTASFNVPDLSTGEYKVKVMYWNNEMVPLDKSYELSEATVVTE